MRLRRETIEARENHLLDGLRNLDLGLMLEPPTVARLNERAGVHQRPHELFEEERVPFRRIEHAPFELRGQRSGTRKRREKLPVRIAERTELNLVQQVGVLPRCAFTQT